MSLEVIEPGALTTVQDAVGRREWRHVGVPAGGAVDRWSARLANRLVGNADDEALLEITLVGPSLRFEDPSCVALVGGFDATVDALPLAPGTAREVRAGSVLRIGGSLDARGYVAVAGGIDVPSVLGSKGTDLRTGFGGVEGRALRAGDRLVTGAPRGPAMRWTGSSPRGPIRVVPGPHIDRVEAAAIERGPWRIGGEADRTGARLDGPTIPATGPPIASMGLPEGAIQLPPDGRPIVMLADRPVTGGYPVPWVVIGADVGRVARLRPGDAITFVTVTVEQARAAWRAVEDELAALEPLREAAEESEEALGSWAEAHD